MTAAARQLILLWLVALCVNTHAASPVYITSAAALATTTDQEYFARHSRTPASNSVQTLNPPILRYPYYEDPGTLTSLGHTRVFRVQITTNGSFASPLVDLVTSNIFFNFFGCITNPNGTTYSNTVHWRVIYMNSNQTVNLYTNPAYPFTMPANAKRWDRARYADKSPGGFLHSLSNVHPRVFIKSTNINTLRTLVNDPVGYFGDIKAVTFGEMTNSISVLSANSWTNDFDTLKTNVNWYYLPGQIEHLGGAYYSVTNEFFTNAINNAVPSVGAVLTNWCGVVKFFNYDRTEAYGGLYFALKSLGNAYDLFWHLMTTEQRAAVLRCMEEWAGFYIAEGWYYYGSQTNLDRAYLTRNLAMNIPSVAIQQDSHGRHDRMALLLCLAGIGDSPKLDYYLQWYLGYYMGKFDGFDFSFEDPRIYGGISTIQDFDRAMKAWFMAAAMFSDDKGFTNAPVYNQMADIQIFQTPIGYRIGGIQPWGPASHFVPTAEQFQGHRHPLTYAGYALLAQMNGRGDLQRAHDRAVALGYSVNGEGSGQWVVEFLSTFWDKPTSADHATNSFIDPVRGWAVGAAHQPTDFAIATNGVFFVFCARPTGNGRSGGSFGDGNIEIGAYGANITWAGAGRYQIAATFMNGLFVNGIGVNNGSPRSPYPIHARFDAYTNWVDGVLIRGDLTYAMNLATNLVGGGTENMQSVLNSQARVNYLQESNARPQIVSVKRTVLFPRNKYFVFYDEFQTTTNSMFQWKWNVFPTNCTAVNTSTMSFSYTATNNYPGRTGVTVYVQHIGNPASMGVTQMVNTSNLVGTNNGVYAKWNPFTGEKFDYTNDWAGMRDTPPLGNDDQDPYWSNTIWVYNRTLVTNWHFMSVVYPVKEGEAAPIITRITDNTVRVQRGSDDDVISFGETNVSPASTLMVEGFASTNQFSGGGGGEETPATPTPRGTITPGARINGGRLSLIIQQSNDLRIWSNYLTNEIAAIDPLKFYRLRIQ